MKSIKLTTETPLDPAWDAAPEAESARWHGFVGADAEVYYMIDLEGGVPISFELIGEGSDIDLWVADETGKLVAESRERGTTEFCSFTPEYSGLYTIWVENFLSPTGAKFELTVA